MNGYSDVEVRGIICLELAFEYLLFRITSIRMQVADRVLQYGDAANLLHLSTLGKGKHIIIFNKFH